MPIKGIARFEKDLQRFGRTLTHKHLVLLQKKLTLELIRRLVLETAVKTGRARGGWFVTINELSEAVPLDLGRNNDKSGRRAIVKAITATQLLAPYATTHVQNNVVYIVPIIEGGHSKQTPAGTFTRVVEEVSSVLPSDVEEVDLD